MKSCIDLKTAIDYIGLEQRYSAPYAQPLPVVMSHGKGSYVYDTDGKAYIDCAAGIGVLNFGHGHPALLAQLVEQAHRIAIIPRLYHNVYLPQLMARACQLTGMDRAAPMNSGAEAVETALKTARKWASVVKHVSPGHAEIIVCQHNFHGRTITATSCYGDGAAQQLFGPLTPGIKRIPYNDIAALAAAITPNTAAFLVEPIQGEGGVIVPDPGYLTACRALCDQHRVLLICDEIQTGMGRTGRFLACEHEGVRPDGVLLGKALGGGLLPISLFLAKAEVLDVLQPGDHGGTFGGNPLAASVALKALSVLIDDGLIEQAEKMGTYFKAQLDGIQSSLINQVRGRGLMLALVIHPNHSSGVTSDLFAQALMKAGVLVIKTREHVLRLLPPLIITKSEIDYVVSIIRNVCENIDASIGR